MKAIELLLKTAVDYDGDGEETLKDDLMDSYDTMARRGAIPAAALGTLAAVKSKGWKNKIVNALAGIGAGYVGTFGAKAGYDYYTRKKREKELKAQELLSQLQQGV